jgi:hypothetical protein
MRRSIILLLAILLVAAGDDVSARVRLPTKRPTKKEPGCHPNYDPCVPIDVDVDCEGGKGDGPSYVRGPIRVIGPDVYDLDRDHDGIGCEPKR